MTTTQDTSGAAIVQPRPGKRPLAATCDTAMVRRLVESNLGLAFHIVRRFRVPAWVDEADIESAAMLALFKAATVFDPGRGVSFAAFAGRVIRNGLIRALKIQRRRRLIVVGDSLDTLADQRVDGEHTMQNAERAYDLAFRLLSSAEYVCVMGRRRGQSPAAKRSTDAELARQLGCARQTICRIRREALLRLRFEAIRNGIEAP